MSAEAQGEFAGGFSGVSPANAPQQSAEASSPERLHVLLGRVAKQLEVLPPDERTALITELGLLATELGSMDQHEEDDADTGVEDLTWKEEDPEVHPDQKDAELPVSVDSIKAYLKQIGKVALLNAEEEVELAKRIEAGVLAGAKLRQLKKEEERMNCEMPMLLRHDLRWLMRDGDRAKDHLLEANLRLVVSLAKRYTGRGMAFLDLIQEGNLGLMRAVEKFDYARGGKFSTYATWWIRQAITRGMADQNRTIRLPEHMSALVDAMERAERTLRNNLGRQPTPDELAQEMGVKSEKEVEQLRRYAHRPLSLNYGEDGSFEDYIQEGEVTDVASGVISGIFSNRLRSMLNILDESQAALVKLYTGADGRPHTIPEIAKSQGLPEGRVQNMLSGAFARMRHPSNLWAIGFNEAEDDWRGRACCSQIGPEPFFAGRGVHAVESTKHICQMCEVRNKCLEYALERSEKHGIWGGLYPIQRESLAGTQADQPNGDNDNATPIETQSGVQDE